MTKKKIELHAEKNQVPQGAWLAFHFQQDAPDSDALSSPEYAAFTTSGAAKRYLASVVGRRRITWNDDNGDGTSLSALVEIMY